MFVLKRKLGGMLAGMEAMAVPPLRVKLVPQHEVPEWAEQASAKKKMEALSKLGFAHCGDFHVPEAGPSTIRAYLSSCGTVSAYLCKHPAKPEAFLDLVRVFEDGSSLTVTDAGPSGLEDCPQHSNIKLTGWSPDKLLQELEERTPDKPVTALSSQKLGPLYERGYAEVMDWRVEKGGVSREEMLANSDKEMTEEEIANALELFRDQHREQLQELLRIRYTEQANMPVSRWEEVRDRLLFVHDQLDEEEVRALFESAVYWLEGPFPRPTKTGREGFQQMLNHLPGNLTIEPAGKVEGSIEADVYLLPEEPEDW